VSQSLRTTKSEAISDTGKVVVKLGTDYFAPLVMTIKKVFAMTVVSQSLRTTKSEAISDIGKVVDELGTDCFTSFAMTAKRDSHCEKRSFEAITDI